MADYPSETAFDPEHPYFDEKSDREKPKWCLVHVKFVQKFLKMIKLKELQKYAKNGGVLENMQGLRQTRLSVSKVSKKEWYVSPMHRARKTFFMSKTEGFPEIAVQISGFGTGLVWEEKR